jgi:sugar fermentation stimulation protein A
VKGAYILLIHLETDMDIEIGALGKIPFSAGYYTYTGSSMVNLEKRVERHFREDKKIKWHIDYLLQRAEAVKAVLFPSHEKEECRVNKMVHNLENGTAIKGFGSSDCSCEAHLAYFGETQPHLEYPQERQTMHPPS